MSRQDLEAIFNWNTEFSTAFKDIKAEHIMKSPVSSLIEAPVELAKVVAKEARGRKETQ